MKVFKLIIFIVALTVVSCKSAKYADLDDGLYADMKTNKGDILLKLTYQLTPVTVANFITLANGTNAHVTDSLKGKHYYDGIVFHRVIKDFMIQGGDPTATGEGDPGYKFKDEFPKDKNGQLLLKHNKAGILSMANGGPATNGSQFFITHKETPWLDGIHTVFGQVVKGQSVVDSIVQYDTIKSVRIIKVGADAKSFKAVKVFNSYFDAEALKQKEIEKVSKATFNKFNELAKKAEELPSGLKMVITNSNNSEFPKSGQEVKVNYAGYFTDGRLFDTSYKEIAKAYKMYDAKRDKKNGYEPFTTVYGPDARLIAGFKEGLQKMRIGDKAVLFIPSHLGYGAQGAGNVIPPNTDLVFELELVGLAD